MNGFAKKHSPVRVFLQHLIDTDTEGFIVVAFMDEIFVYPKLRSGDRLALWDTWQVKTEFSVMSSHWQELFIVLHWNERIRRGNIRDKKKSKSQTESAVPRRWFCGVSQASAEDLSIFSAAAALGLPVPCS